MSKWSDPGRHAATLSQALAALGEADTKDRRELAQVSHDAEFQGSICGRRYSGDENYSEAVVDDWSKVADAHRKAVAIIERIQTRMTEARQFAAEMRQAEAERRALDEAAEKAERKAAEKAERERLAAEKAERLAAEKAEREAEKARRAALTPAERRAEERLAKLQAPAEAEPEPEPAAPRPRLRPEERTRLERKRLEDRESELTPEERKRLEMLRLEDHDEREGRELA